MDDLLRLRDDGVELLVRLTPKSSTDRLEGFAESADGRRHLKARVRAIPEKGAANTALERLLAKALDVPFTCVSVVAGGTSRLKSVRVQGDAVALAARIAKLG